MIQDSPPIAESTRIRRLFVLLCGFEILPGECSDDAAALKAIQRLKAIEKQCQASTLLFHDPVAIQAMKLAPDAYT